MVERGEDFRLALKASQAIRIAGHRGGQHLDRHRPLQIAVGRAIDLAHSAFADLGRDFVDAEPRAGKKGQSLWVWPAPSAGPTVIVAPITNVNAARCMSRDGIGSDSTPAERA
jgi:hypothetical protein